ncbi:MAG: hypothetical protein H8E55_19805 [Pelagibacterales bacterium]|nr:hypothetical protein [Pelagibacterales bacterium]
MVNILNLFKTKKEDKRKSLTRSTAAVDALNDELERLHALLLALATNTDHNVINSRTLAEGQIKELQKVLTEVAKMPPLVVEIVDT